MIGHPVHILANYLIGAPTCRFTLKSFKRLYFVIRDLSLSGYKSSADMSQAVVAVNIKGCEVTPEINLAARKYQIKLEIPSAEGMGELWLR